MGRICTLELRKTSCHIVRPPCRVPTICHSVEFARLTRMRRKRCTGGSTYKNRAGWPHAFVRPRRREGAFYLVQCTHAINGLYDTVI
jgi:hypothetical protein